MTRVLLLEDHVSFRETLAFMLDREPDMEVTAEAGSLREAATLDADADLAIVDLGLPAGRGGWLGPLCGGGPPRRQALVLTAETDRPAVACAIEAGAAGVVNKTDSLRHIIDAARRVARGEVLLSSQEMLELVRVASEKRSADTARSALVARLTPRERQILQHLAEGLTSKQIAYALSITVETQRTHMVNIFSKLGVHSQLQALLVAIKEGVVTLH
jgi:two-component system nitrate/nitrite response regulator NarL